MPKKQAITAESLFSLGAPKLVEVLVELAASNPDVAERLERLLSVTGSGKPYAAAIRKQLSSLIGKNRYYDYYEAGGLAGSLDGIRQSIVSDMGAQNPALAAELLKELLEACDRAVECADDSNGEIGAVFTDVATNWAEALCNMPNADSQKLAEELFEIITRDQYGFTDSVIEKASPALGNKGMKALEKLTRKALADLPKPKPAASDAKPRMKVVLGRNADPSVLPALLGQMGVGFGGVDLFDLEGNELVSGAAASRYIYTGLLRDIADAKGDVDLFIEACGMDERPEAYAQEIAERLINKNRAEEALAWLAKSPTRGEWFDDKPVWLKIKALEQLGRKDDAQTTRWDAFQRSMDERFYVDYVDHAPKAEHDTIRTKAIEEAHCQLNPYRAIAFLTWLRDTAALKELVLKYKEKLNGDYYRELTAAADFLAPEEPEAAALIYRSMVTRVLEKGSSKYYVYAARNLRKAEACAQHFRDGQSIVSTHAEYMQALKSKHGRKYSFWQQAEKPEKARAEA